MFKALKAFFKDEEGQGMVEYGLIIALVAVGLIAGLGVLKDGLGDTFSGISKALNKANEANAGAGEGRVKEQLHIPIASVQLTAVQRV